MGNGIPANAVALLRKAAADADLRDRMEKSAKARLAGGLFGAGVGAATGGVEGAGIGAAAGLAGGKRMFSRPAGLSTAPPHAMTRAFSGARTAATVGGATAGAAGLAGTHTALNRNADNTHGMSSNPYTWGRNKGGQKLGLNQGPSREQVFERNQQGLDDVFNRSGLKAEMDAASASGDHKKLFELTKRQAAGDFDVDHGWSTDRLMAGKIGDINPLSYRLGGLNPWAHDKAQTSMGRMGAQQKGLQGEYDAKMRQVGPQPGDAELMQQLQEQLNSDDLLPHQHAAYAKQMEMIKTRMGGKPGEESPDAAAIRQRMTGVGMRHRGWKPPAAPGAAPAPAAPQSGVRNLSARRGVQGWAPDMYDFRHRPKIDQPDSTFQFGA